jgi:hypothetical protein
MRSGNRHGSGSGGFDAEGMKEAFTGLAKSRYGFSMIDG